MAKIAGKKDPAGSVKWSYVVFSLFLMALGVCAVVWPDIGLATVCIAIGAGATVFGIIRIIVYFLRELRGVALSYDFSIGLLGVILGIILLVHPQGVIDFLQVVIGFFLLLDSVFKLQTALDSRRIGMSGWWVPLIFTLACLTLGVLMILKVGANVLMVLIGVSLIADGAQNLCMFIFSQIAAKQLARMDKDGDGMPDIIDMTEESAAPSAPASPAAEKAPDPKPDATIYDNEGDNEP
jgi:uncharacterized membrane protein HdeD (DUF308 family)